MHRGSIGAVGRWWVGGVGVEPHPFWCAVGYAAVTEITDGVGPVNRINTPPNFIILDEEVHFIFAASQREIGVQRTSLRVVVAPDEQVLPGLQRDTWKRPSPRFHAPVAEKHSIAIVGYVSSIDELDPISIVSVFICSESVVDGHHFVDSNGVVSKCAPDPGHRAGRMVDGTSRIRDCGLPEDIFRAVERDDVCPAISVQSTNCGLSATVSTLPSKSMVASTFQPVGSVNSCAQHSMRSESLKTGPSAQHCTIGTTSVGMGSDWMPAQKRENSHSPAGNVPRGCPRHP